MRLTEASGHDNVLLSYSVDMRKREVRLCTGTYPYENPAKYQDFIFTGVVAYQFECDLFSNIIYDIEEVSLESIYEDHLEHFQRLQAEGWPMIKDRCDSREELLFHLKEQDVRGYKVDATMGLRGWIYAQSCTVEEIIRPQL